MTATETFASVLAEGAVELAAEHGVIVVALALIGGVGLLNAVLKQATPIFNILFFIFILTPVIAILSVHDKEYGSVVVNEVKDITSYVKTNPKATKQISRYALAVVFALVAGLAYSYYQIQAAGLV